MGYRLDHPRADISTASGVPIVGAKMFVYENGTTTPVTLYSDRGCTTPAANPVLTDASGRWPVRYVATNELLTIVVKDAADATLYTDNDFDGYSSGYANTTLTAIGTTQVTYRWNHNPTPLTSFEPLTPAQNYEGFSVELGTFGARSFSGYGLPTAITGLVAVPAGPDLSPIAHAAGVAGYASTVSRRTGAVGVYGEGRTGILNGGAWGGNFLATDQGFSTNLIYGCEVNVNVTNASSTPRGIDVIGGSTEEPALSFGYRLGALGTFAAPKKRWIWGIELTDASAVVGMMLGTTAESANTGSMPIRFNHRNASNVVTGAADMQALTDGSFGIFGGIDDKTVNIETRSGGTSRRAITCWQNQVAIGSPSSLPTYSLDVWGSILVRGVMLVSTYTVATLPTALVGMRAIVTNANSTTFHSVVAGGGANTVPVFYDGANWRIG